MSITHEQLYMFCLDWWHWSERFPLWLVQVYRTGIRSGHAPEDLAPILDQIRDELREDHPSLLRRTYPNIDPTRGISTATTELLYFADSHGEDFPSAVHILHEGERLALMTYRWILKEAPVRSREGPDLTFFERHVELDSGPHADGAASLLRLIGTAPGQCAELLNELRGIRRRQLQTHFDDQILEWFPAPASLPRTRSEIPDILI